MKQQFVKPLFLRALNAAFVVVWAVLLGGCMRASTRNASHLVRAQFA